MHASHLIEMSAGRHTSSRTPRWSTLSIAGRNMRHRIYKCGTRFPRKLYRATPGPCSRSYMGRAGLGSSGQVGNSSRRRGRRCLPVAASRGGLGRGAGRVRIRSQAPSTSGELQLLQGLLQLLRGLGRLGPWGLQLLQGLGPCGGTGSGCRDGWLGPCLNSRCKRHVAQPSANIIPTYIENYKEYGPNGEL